MKATVFKVCTPLENAQRYCRTENQEIVFGLLFFCFFLFLFISHSSVIKEKFGIFFCFLESLMELLIIVFSLDLIKIVHMHVCYLTFCFKVVYKMCFISRLRRPEVYVSPCSHALVCTKRKFVLSYIITGPRRLREGLGYKKSK